MRIPAPAAALIALLALTAAGHAQSVPTIDGLKPELFARVQEMIAGGIHRIGVPPSAGCAPDGRPARAVRPQSACRTYYDRMFGDGEVNIGIGLGYMDPAVDGFSPNDRFLTLVENLTRPCADGVDFACGFTRIGGENDVALTGANGQTLPGTSFTVLVKTVQYRTASGELRPVTVRVPICNPYSPSRLPQVQAMQQTTCASFFAQSVRYDDITMYMGHSRYGAGPDFHPPRTLSGSGATPEIDHHFYENSSAGVDTYFSPGSFTPVPGSTRTRPEYKQLYMLSCSSQQFADRIRRSRKAAGFGNSDFDFVGTNTAIEQNGTETLRIIEALGQGECGAGIARAAANTDDTRFSFSITESVSVVLRPPRLQTGELFRSSR